jgi:NNP family nitrate/nitrite transporter-like MFS transporter
MFNTKIVGTANAIVGGWGNLGGGFTFLLMPGLFQLMKVIGADEFLAWKIAVVIPALLCIALGNRCLSPLMMRVRIPLRERCTTLYDKVCQ